MIGKDFWRCRSDAYKDEDWIVRCRDIIVKAHDRKQKMLVFTPTSIEMEWHKAECVKIVAEHADTVTTTFARGSVLERS
jgi:hypothetical protein